MALIIAEQQENCKGSERARVEFYGGSAVTGYSLGSAILGVQRAEVFRAAALDRPRAMHIRPQKAVEEPCYRLPAQDRGVLLNRSPLLGGQAIVLVSIFPNH